MKRNDSQTTDLEANNSQWKEEFKKSMERASKSHGIAGQTFPRPFLQPTNFNDLLRQKASFDEVPLLFSSVAFFFFLSSHFTSQAMDKATLELTQGVLESSVILQDTLKEAVVRTPPRIDPTRDRISYPSLSHSLSSSPAQSVSLSMTVPLQELSHADLLPARKWSATRDEKGKAKLEGEEEELEEEEGAEEEDENVQFFDAAEQF